MLSIGLGEELSDLLACKKVGSAMYYLMFMSDHTHTKQLLQGIFEASLSSVMLIKALRDEKNNIVDFFWVLLNQRALDLYPSPKGEMEIGKRVSQVFPAYLASENFKRWIHTTETGESYQGEYLYEFEGVTTWMRERGVKFEDGVIVTSEDITEQKVKEDKLIRSEALLLESQEIAQLGAFQWNEDMTLGYWTPEMFKIYGVEPYSVKVTPGLIASIVHPEDKEKFLTAVGKVKSSHEPYSVEYRAIVADGSTKYLWARGKMVNGRLTGTVMDITERKLHEEKLQRSEALLLESQEIAQLGAFQWNEDMSEAYWTPQLFKLYGVEPNSTKVTLRLLDSVIHPEDKERFFAVIHKAKTLKEPYSIKYRAITADGDIKHLWARGRIVNGKLTGTAMDITEQKLHEEKLQRSEELLLEGQEIAQIGTFQMKEWGEIYWTKQMYKLFEIDPSVKLTTSLIDRMIHPADLGKFIDSSAQIIQLGQSHTIEYRLIMPDGRVKHIWSRAKMINGIFTGTAMDITERKELELKNRKLALRNDELDSFVYTASHDLRSPVSNIEMLVSFLDQEIPDKTESVGLYLSLVNQSIVDLKNTLQDLTTVTEIHPGEQRELVNLQEMIEDVKVSLYKQIEEAGAIIDTKLSIPFLKIPKKHARSLLYNLLFNAIKFRSKDRLLMVTISTYLKNGRVHLSFQDNGIGIKEVDQPKVFIIFKRFNKDIAGMGVGMYLVKRVIDLNEGGIYLESKENVGTTFYIDFPMAYS